MLDKDLTCSSSSSSVFFTPELNVNRVAKRSHCCFFQFTLNYFKLITHFNRVLLLSPKTDSIVGKWWSSIGPAETQLGSTWQTWVRCFCFLSSRLSTTHVESFLEERLSHHVGQHTDQCCPLGTETKTRTTTTDLQLETSRKCRIISEKQIKSKSFATVSR